MTATTGYMQLDSLTDYATGNTYHVDYGLRCVLVERDGRCIGVIGGTNVDDAVKRYEGRTRKKE